MVVDDMISSVLSVLNVFVGNQQLCLPIIVKSRLQFFKPFLPFCDQMGTEDFIGCKDKKLNYFIIFSIRAKDG